jgi:hypothetical protein
MITHSQMMIDYNFKSVDADPYPDFGSVRKPYNDFEVVLFRK